MLNANQIPEFYARDDSGIPTAWVKRMRASMAQFFWEKGLGDEGGSEQYEFLPCCTSSEKTMVIKFKCLNH